MSQQINLYQPIFRQQRKVFSAATMAQIAAAITLGLALLYGFGRWQETAIGHEVATLQAQRDAAQAQFDQLTAELAARRDAGTLNRQIEQAEQAIAARRQLLRWLTEHGGDPATGGFADRIEGLARQHRAGVQLAEIGLSAGGREVRLVGSTDDAAELVRYLRRLGDEPAFASTEFRSVQIERAADTDEAVGFVVSSEPLEPEQ